MKKQLLLLIGYFSLLFSDAQVVDFESLTIPSSGYENGQNLSGGFILPPLFFENNYDTAFSSWSGFAYSNQQDSTTAGYLAQYASRAGKGALGSSNYAVSFINYLTGTSVIRNQNLNMKINGFYITNNTYAALDMKNGSTYSKQFGGVSGNDSDYFILKIKNYLHGQVLDTLDFYLADYRFSNNSQDYIVNDWLYVDVSNFDFTDSLVFSLVSSDNGQFGMNTPAYFCIDEISYTSTLGTIENSNVLPVQLAGNMIIGDLTYLNWKSQTTGPVFMKIINANGQLVFDKILYSSDSSMELNNLTQGFYVVTFSYNNKIYSQKLIKN